MSKLPFRGIWLPGEVFMDERLSQSSKLLWGIIHILSNEKGCYASRATLGEYMGCSERNVQHLIEELITHGFVRRDGAGVLWDLWLDKGVKEISRGGEKNFIPGVKETSPNRNKTIGMSRTKAQELEALVNGLDKEIGAKLLEYMDLRRVRKWTNSPRWVAKMVKYLQGYPKSWVMDALDTSIRNEWQSVHVKGALFRPPTQVNDHTKGF